MPKTPAADTTEAVETIGEMPVASTELTLFHFPTIGQGISIRAATLQEAQEIASKLQ